MNNTYNDKIAENVPQRLETSEGAEILCKTLFETTADLISLLERETSLLRKAKTEDITVLQVRKQALSVTLTKSMGVLRDNAEYIKMAAPGHIDQLKDQQRQFQKSLEANHDALSAMKAVSEQLIHTIAAKAGEKRSGPDTYGKDAGLSNAQKVGAGAISIDTTL